MSSLYFGSPGVSVRNDWYFPGPFVLAAANFSACKNGACPRLAFRSDGWPKTRPTSSTAVGGQVTCPLSQLVRNAGATRRGYFLRAETMHGFFTYLEKNPSTVGTDISFHDMSHGESFLELAVDRFRGRGLWVLDEPESALSFAGCLSLLAVLKDLLAEGSSQVIMSTHSPVLAALPGAQILEVGPWGLRQQEWPDLDLVSNWRSFLDSPERYLRHL